MKQKKTGRAAKLYLGFTGLLLGASVGLALIPWVERFFGTESLLMFELGLIASYVVLALIAYVLSIFFHEGGHLLAGLKSGYTFVSFRLLSFMLIRREGKLELKRFKLAGTGGQCLMKPPAWTDKGIPTQLYNWGGVIANVVACAILLPCVLLTPRDTLGGAFLLALLLFNAYAALTNGVPILGNDGHNALHLTSDRPAQYAFWQQMTANALLAEGVDEKDMPAELYTLPENADLSNPMLAAAAVSAATRGIAIGDYDGAEEAISTLLKRKDAAFAPLHRFLMQNDLMYLQLARQGKPDEDMAALQTDKTYARFKKGMANYPSVIRTAYVEAVSAGEEGKAAGLRAKLDRLADSFPYPQIVRGERELMDEADRRIKAVKDGAEV